MIPYNPSSFNSNKTILEQILELKRWLIDHPSYRVFEVNANFDPLDNEYQLSAVYDEDGVMNTGDVAMFLNSYVASVQSVDRDNGTFLTWDGINIKGPSGATGPRGPQGVSITGVTIDASGHLIVTLSNGNTIDAGSVISGTGAYVIQLTSYTGTLSADDLAIVNDPSKLCVIDYYENSKHSFYFKDRQITGGWRFSNLDYVEGSQITLMWYIEIDGTTGAYLQNYSEVFIRAENINSYGATSGQVLQADGNGDASWQTPQSSGMEVVTISSSSGNISLADVDKLKTNNCLLYRSDVERYFIKLQQSTTQLVYTAFYRNPGNTRMYDNKITITISNGSYSASSNTIPVSINPISATSGQVLTADGNGDCSWQTPQSSDHIVIITSSSGTLSASDVTTLQNDDGILSLVSGSNHYIHTKYNETSTELTYRQIQFDTTGGTYWDIVITKSSGVYSRTNKVINIRGVDIKSSGATNGQVLTANGSGGASWQNAGGGSTLYVHNITFYNNTSPYTIQGSFIFINDSNTSLNSLSSIASAISNKLGLNTRMGINGGYTGGKIIVAITAPSVSTLQFYIYNPTDNTYALEAVTDMLFIDNQYTL